MSCVSVSTAVTVALSVRAVCTTTSSGSGISMVQDSLSTVWQAITYCASPSPPSGGMRSAWPESSTSPATTLQRQVPQRPAMQLYDTGIWCARSTSSRLAPGSTGRTRPSGSICNSIGDCLQVFVMAPIIPANDTSANRMA